jgi:hypothetical protein
MRRVGWLLVFVVLLAMVPAGAAAAGGFTSLEFERRYYVPGEMARGKADFWVEVSDLKKKGSFYAYLLPSRLSIHPPTIPNKAVPLGPVRIAPVTAGEGATARARLAFRVPDVSSGGYQIALCNRPCHETFIGDLGGGWIQVVATPEQARLLNFGDKLERRLEERFWDTIGELWTSVERLQSEAGDMETRLSGLAIDIQGGDSVEADIISRMDRAESQLAQMQRRVTDLADGAGWPSRAAPWFGLASGWLAALVVASLWVRNSLRARRPPSRDVPEDHSAVDLGDLTIPAASEGQADDDLDGRGNGHGSLPQGLSPYVTAASRRAMSLAGRLSRAGKT